MSSELCSEVIDFFEPLLVLLECYLPLANAHSNDFLIEDSWNLRLPTAVSTELELLFANDPIQLVHRFISIREHLTNNHNEAAVIRDELLCLRDQSQSIAPCFVTSSKEFKKEALPLWLHGSLDDFLRACAACCLETSGLLSASSTTSSTSSSCFVPHGMSCKKSHEVQCMSVAAVALLKDMEVKWREKDVLYEPLVVDIGSGKGYFGTYLNLQHGARVFEIDSEESNSLGAQRRREKMIPRWISLLRKEVERNGLLELECKKEQMIKARCDSLTACVSTSDDLKHLIEKHDPACQDLLLTGLHTCGYLATTLLQLFATCSSSRSLLCVGCCYHLFTELHYHSPELEKMIPGIHKSYSPHFPMSRWLRQRSSTAVAAAGFVLGRNSRVLASQSVERLAAGLVEIHCSIWYRVLLQRYLLEHVGRVSDDWQVGRIGRQCRDILQFFQMGLRRLGFDDLADSVSEADISALEERFVAFRSRLQLFYLVRCCLAPAIEATILVDRLLFLKEAAVDARLTKLFDPLKSPRCYAFFATKIR